MARISPGVPGRCPTCDGLGYIDSVDISHRYQVQHCTVCLHRWEYLFDAEGVVVGLTDLDEFGQPVARSRVRPPSASPVAAEAPPAPEDAPPADVADDLDVVLDLRDGVPPVTARPDLTAAEQLSPAEWIRQSVRS